MKRKISGLLAAFVVVAGLLTTGMFSVTAEAAALYTYSELPAGDFTYTISKGADGVYSADDTLTVTAYTGTATAVQLPGVVKVSNLTSTQQAYYTSAGVPLTTELTVTAAGARFLYSSKQAGETTPTPITGIRLHENTEMIGDRAFCDSDTLREIEIPADSKLKTIYMYACSNTSLERIGINGTDKMPATLTDVRGYAFRKTLLSSIDFSACTKLYDLSECSFAQSAVATVKMPPNLKYLGWSAFDTCENLTSVTLSKYLSSDKSQLDGEDEESAGYLGPHCFENCKNLTSVTFQGNFPSSGWAALKGVSRDCVVKVNKPANAADYQKAVDFVYSSMCANADVKLRWNGSSAGKTVPSVSKSSNLITLSGADAGSYTLNYDVTDADGDGVGGILIVKGRQNVADPLKITFNGNQCSNTTYVRWGEQQAYGSQREGTVNGEMLFGAELAEMMARTQPLGYTPSAQNQTKTPTTSLQLSLINDSLGSYYYTPLLVNTGSYSTPQTSKALPALLVIYQPGDTDSDKLSATLNTASGSSAVKISGSTVSAEDVADLSGNTSVNVLKDSTIYCSGFETLFPRETVLQKGVTTAYIDENNYIKYKWYNQSHGGSAGEGYAVFDGYENVRPSGVQWKVPGIDANYFAGKSTGSYKFDLTVTVVAGGVEHDVEVSNEMTVHFYNDIVMTGYTPKSIEAGSGNWTVNESNDGSSYSKPALMNRGTHNVTLTPQDNISGMNIDGYAQYTWYYQDITHSGPLVMAGVSPVFISDWLPDTENTVYRIRCGVVLYTSDDVRLTTKTASNNPAYYIKVTDTAASYPQAPVFDEDAMKVVYFALQPVEEVKAIWVPGENMDNVKTIEVYKAPNATANRGGKLIGRKVGATVTPGDGGAWITLSDSFSFSDYEARWCYLRIITNDVTYAYSPVFAALPDYHYVNSFAELPHTEAEITQAPDASVYMPTRGTPVSLTYGVKLTNIPLQYATYDCEPILDWQYFDVNDGSVWKSFNVDNAYPVAGSTYNAANVSCQLDKVDIVEGNLLLEGTVTFTSRYINSTTGVSHFLGDNYEENTTLDTRLNLTNIFQDYQTPAVAATSGITTLNSANAVPVIIDSYSNDAGGDKKWTAVWDSNLSNYVYSYQTDSSLAEGQYILYSDSYDRVNSNNSSNQPASPEVFTAQATVQNSTLFTAKLYWRIYDPKGTLLTTLTPESPTYTYSTGDAYTISYGGNDYEFPAYTDTLTASYETVNLGTTTGIQSTLTASVPGTKNKYSFTIIPEAVYVNTRTGQLVSAVTGNTRTLLVNPQKTTNAPYLGGSTSPVLISTTTLENAATDDTVLYTLQNYAWSNDGGSVTARWYQSRNPNLRSPGSTSTPIGPTVQLGVGGGSIPLELTKAMLSKVKGSASSGTMYYYLYMINNNPNTLDSGTASTFASVCRVTVGDFPVLAAPELTPYEESDSASLYWGGELSDTGILSLTTNAKPVDVDRTISIVATTTDTLTGEVYANNATVTVGVWKNGEDPKEYFGAVATNPDGTIVWTVDARTVGVGDSYRVYYDEEKNYWHYDSGNLQTVFHWEVEDRYVGSMEMAAGGKQAASVTGDYTITQLCPNDMSVTELTLDYNASRAASGSGELQVSSPETSRGDFGCEGLVRAFREIAGYPRDFSFLLNVPEWAGGEYGGNVQLQYWHPTYGWCTCAYGRYMSPNSQPLDGAYSSVYGDNTRFTTKFDDYVTIDGDYRYPAIATQDAEHNDVEAIYLRAVAYPELIQGEGEDVSTRDIDTAPACSEVFAVVRMDKNVEIISAMEPVEVTAPQGDYYRDVEDTSDLTLDLGEFEKAEGDPSPLQLQYQLLYGGTVIDSGFYTPGMTASLHHSRPELVAAAEEAKDAASQRIVQYQLQIINEDVRPEVNGNQKSILTRTINVHVGRLAKTPVVVLQDANGTTLAEDASFTFRRNGPEKVTVTAVVTNAEELGETASLSYQWYYTVEGDEGGPYWTSGTEASFELPNDRSQICRYYCEVSNYDSNATALTRVKANSPAVKVTTEGPKAPVNVWMVPSENQQSLHMGGQTVLPVNTDTYSDDDATLEYQWVMSTDAAIDFETDTVLHSSRVGQYGGLTVRYSDFTNPDVTELYFGLRARTLRFGVYSDWTAAPGAVKVTLRDKLAPAIAAVGETDFHVGAGQTATMTALATSQNTYGAQPYGEIRYQWYWSSTADGAKYSLSNTDPTYTPEALPKGGTRYYWVQAYEVSSTSSQRTDYSPWLCFTMIADDWLAPTIAAEGETTRLIPAGETTTLTVSAESRNGGGAYGELHYKWAYSITPEGYRDSITNDSPTLTPETMAEGGTRYYWASAYETITQGGASTAASDAVCFTVSYQAENALPPIVTRVTPYITYGESGTMTLTATATSPDGGVLSYQWQQKDFYGSWQDIPDAAGASYTATFADVPGITLYRLKVTNTRDDAAGDKSAVNYLEFSLVRRGFGARNLPTLPSSMLSGQTLDEQQGVIYWYGEEPAADSLNLSLVPIGSWLTLTPHDYYRTNNGYSWEYFTLSGTATANIADIGISAEVHPDGLTLRSKTFSLGSVTVDDFSTADSSMILGVMDGDTVSGQITVNKMVDGVPAAAEGTYSLKSGVLPDGVALNSDGSFALAPSADKLGDPGRWPISVLFTEADTGKTYTANLDVIIQSEANVQNAYAYLTDSSGTQINLRENPTGTGYAYDKEAGVLTLTDGFAARRLSLPSYKRCIRLEGASTLTGTDMGEAINGYYIYFTGSGSLDITDNFTSGFTNTPYGIRAHVTLRESFTGSLNVNINSAIELDGYSVYGVYGQLTQQSDTGTVTINVTQTGGKCYAVWGVINYNLTVSAPGAVSITVDGGNVANAIAAETMTTSGSVNVKLTAKNGVSDTQAARSVTLGHTGGAAELTAQSASGSARAALYQPANESDYKITGAYSSGYVKYEAPANASPIFTVDGVDQTSLPLNLEKGIPMVQKSISAYCTGGCTLEVQPGDWPNGVSYIQNNNVITISGKPTATGSGSVTIKATSKLDPAKVTNFVVSWNVSDYAIQLSWFDGGYAVYDPNTALAYLTGSGSDSRLYAFSPNSDVASMTIEPKDTAKLTRTSGYLNNYTNFYFTDHRTGNNYRYWAADFTAAGMAVDDETVVTVTAYDSVDTVLATKDFTVRLANKNAVAKLAQLPSSGSWQYYYGTQYTDYGETDASGNGWSWDHKTGVLTLKNYSGQSFESVDSSAGLFAVEFAGQNLLTQGLRARNDQELVLRAKDSGARLDLTATGDRTISAGKLTVEGPGRVYAKSGNDQTLLDSTENPVPVSIGNEVKSLWIEGTFAKPLAVTVEAGGADYYLYNNNTDLLIYGTSVEGMGEAAAITGDEEVTTGSSVTLTATVPEWITGAKDKNGNAAINLTYQWQKLVSGGTWQAIAGETGSTLEVTAESIGAADTSAQYRCLTNISFNGSYGASTSAAHTVTVKAAGAKVAGTLQSRDKTAVDGVTLMLTDTTNETNIYATSATAAGEAVDGVYTTSFAFEGVAFGKTYTLTVGMGSGRKFTTTVIVGETDITDLEITINLLGDVNNNGTVNNVDVLWIRQYLRNERELSEAQLICADVNGNGTVNTTDILWIRQRLQGKRDENYVLLP